MAVEFTNEVVAEILVSNEDLLSEISFHDPLHKAQLIKKIVFTFIVIKGKHLCRSVNIEENSLVRHKNTKTILFKHE